VTPAKILFFPPVELSLGWDMIGQAFGVVVNCELNQSRPDIHSSQRCVAAQIEAAGKFNYPAPST
jgi:hypothetical protein